MKKQIVGAALLAGSASPAFAHTLSPQDGMAALYHQLLGTHHLPLTVILVVIGVVFFARRKTTDN